MDVATAPAYSVRLRYSDPIGEELGEVIRIEDIEFWTASSETAMALWRLVFADALARGLEVSGHLFKSGEPISLLSTVEPEDYS